MLAALTDYLPATRNFLRQIVPPVLATLIAALLIAGFNRAFSVHLVQPRMAAMHSDSAPAEDGSGPAGTAATVKRQDGTTAMAPVTEILKAPERIFAKDADREAEKDQPAIKIAAPAPAPASVGPRVAARKPEPQVGDPRVIEPRISEPRISEPRIATAPVPAVPGPVVAAPPVAAYPVAQQPAVVVMQPVAPATAPIAEAPPPVISAKPMVTVPDRARPAYPAPGTSQGASQEAAGEPGAAPRPPERFVDQLRPSALFDRMREFGERIEAAGNEILPNIRQ